MKYITCILFVLLVAGCAHTSATSAPVNFVGLWKGTSDSLDVGPPLELVFNFMSDGQDIRGSMRNETRQGEWIKLENLKIKGDKIYFSTVTNTPQGAIKVKYNGRLVDSVINLSAKYERAGSPGNPFRGTKPSFRYEGPSGGSLSTTSNIIDDANPGKTGKIDLEKALNTGTIFVGELTIRKVQ